jgi:GNAT superfamily N-acetyltransferase
VVVKPVAGYHRVVAESDLDNPIWFSLHTRHRHLARGDAGGITRYPPEYAPFGGVADTGAWPDATTLVAPGETLLLLGVAPRVGPDWILEPLETLAQMVCRAPVDRVDGPEIIELDPSHRDDVLALTALVYPHYFRPRTMELGRYFGIYRDGRLAAMAGERMATDTHTELSAICTHPGYTGRGYASHLIAYLVNDTLARGHIPFLHASYDNPHALTLYRRLGWRLRRDIPFWSLRAA